MGLVILCLWVAFAGILEFPYSLPFPENIVLARTAMIPGLAGNHLAIVLLLTGAIIGNVALTAWGKPREMLLRGKDGIFKGILTALKLAAWHEYLYIFGYTLVYGPSWDMLSYKSLWTWLSPVVIFLNWKWFGWKRRDSIFILSLLPFYAFWILIGFPVSVQYGSISTLFKDFETNLIEILSWSWCIAAFFVVYYYRANRQKNKSPQVIEISQETPQRNSKV